DVEQRLSVPLAERKLRYRVPRQRAFASAVKDAVRLDDLLLHESIDGVARGDVLGGGGLRAGAPRLLEIGVSVGKLVAEEDRYPADHRVSMSARAPKALPVRDERIMVLRTDQANSTDRRRPI